MARRENDFNFIAGGYDFLSRIVFGKSLITAQRYFLRQIPPSAKILILGGGTGSIAEDILRLNPGVHITYIDASEKMVAISRKKLERYGNVRLICGTQDSIPNEVFDVILTNFFLDLFTQPQLQKVVAQIRSYLINDGQWLVTDFVGKSWWHKMMLILMYRFFRVVSNVRVNRLPDWNEQILRAGFDKLCEAKFYGKFMETCVYRKIIE